MIIDKEVWRTTIVDGYEVSNHGRIRSIDRIRLCGIHYRRFRGRILSTVEDGRGYLKVDLWYEGNRICSRIHKLVLAAFIGPCPIGMEACHNDGVSVNNYVDNLRWDTPQNNQADRLIHGTHGFGSNNSKTKLTDVNVLEIRSRCNNGERQVDVGCDFGISQQSVSKIVTRKRWAMLTQVTVKPNYFPI